jgi:hypothetical protein
MHRLDAASCAIVPDRTRSPRGERLSWPRSIAVIAVLASLGWLGVAWLVRVLVN